MVGAVEWWEQWVGWWYIGYGRRTRGTTGGGGCKRYLKGKCAWLSGFGEVLAGALFVVCVELVVARVGMLA